MSQPDPLQLGNQPHVADEVISDIRYRKEHGVRTYGVALAAHNGRRALQDMYEELLDGAHYVRQRLDEEDRALRTIVGDASVRTSLSGIYDRIEVIRKNPGKVNTQSLENRYVDDLSYMRMVAEALLVELAARKDTPPQVPAGYEVAGHQYRIAHPTETPVYEAHIDHDWAEEWASDPDGEHRLVDGYYPEYRRLLAEPEWYRVHPKDPPGAPEGYQTVPVATEPARGGGKPS